MPLLLTRTSPQRLCEVSSSVKTLAKRCFHAFELAPVRSTMSVASSISALFQSMFRCSGEAMSWVYPQGGVVTPEAPGAFIPHRANPVRLSEHPGDAFALLTSTFSEYPVLFWVLWKRCVKGLPNCCQRGCSNPTAEA
jgi:hypothetical protein